MSHLGYLHGKLQMFGTENEVYNCVALQENYGMLSLRIRAFPPPEL